MAHYEIKKMENTKGKSAECLPRQGLVSEVCQEWVVHEDQALAYRLQNEEYTHHLGHNKERNALLRKDTPRAKEEQFKADQESARVQYEMELGLLRQEARDAAIAAAISEQLEKQELEERRLREQRDFDMAKKIFVQEKQKVRQKKELRQVDREAAYLGINSGLDNVALLSRNDKRNRQLNASEETPQRRSARPLSNDFTDLSDFCMKPDPALDEEEMRAHQETQDEELALLLQEQEIKRRGDLLREDQLCVIEAQDKELAKVLQEQEKAKSKKLREKARQRNIRKQDQQQQGTSKQQSQDLRKQDQQQALSKQQSQDLRKQDQNQQVLSKHHQQDIRKQQDQQQQPPQKHQSQDRQRHSSQSTHSPSSSIEITNRATHNSSPERLGSPQYATIMSTRDTPPQRRSNSPQYATPDFVNRVQPSSVSPSSAGDGSDAGSRSRPSGSAERRNRPPNVHPAPVVPSPTPSYPNIACAIDPTYQRRIERGELTPTPTRLPHLPPPVEPVKKPTARPLVYEDEPESLVDDDDDDDTYLPPPYMPIQGQRRTASLEKRKGSSKTSKEADKGNCKQQ